MQAEGMDIIGNLSQGILSALWIMLPAYVPNPVAALLGGGTPIDLGRNFSDGRRWLGDGKTYRGLVLGIASGIAAGCVQLMLQPASPFGRVPLHTLTSVLLMASGALMGDLVKSFFKRRLGKEQGESWPLADQYDLVLGAFALLAIFDPEWLATRLTIPAILFILLLTPLLHKLVNIIGYITGVKDVPW